MNRKIKVIFSLLIITITVHFITEKNKLYSTIWENVEKKSAGGSYSPSYDYPRGVVELKANTIKDINSKIKDIPDRFKYEAECNIELTYFGFPDYSIYFFYFLYAIKGILFVIFYNNKS